MTERPALGLTLRPPWLLLDLGEPHRVLGWPVAGPARTRARHIAWRQVTDADLTPDVAPAALFRRLARADDVPADIGLMTAARIADYAHCGGPGGVDAVTTVGLGNAESVVACPAAAHAAPMPAPVGTINLVVRLPCPLSPGAALEALSIAASARTAAILALGLRLADGRPVTGTGTDCILIAAPLAGTPCTACGLHTAIGRGLAAAAHAAVERAGRTWLTHRRR